MSKNTLHEIKDEALPSAVLVAVYTDTTRTERDLDELASLLETAGGRAVARLIQYRPTPDNATYIGRGKLEELKELCENEGIELVIFDCELSPSQINADTGHLCKECDYKRGYFAGADSKTQVHHTSTSGTR